MADPNLEIFKNVGVNDVGYIIGGGLTLKRFYTDDNGERYYFFDEELDNNNISKREFNSNDFEFDKIEKKAINVNDGNRVMSMYDGPLTEDEMNVLWYMVYMHDEDTTEKLLEDKEENIIIGINSIDKLNLSDFIEEVLPDLYEYSKDIEEYSIEKKYVLKTIYCLDLLEEELNKRR